MSKRLEGAVLTASAFGLVFAGLLVFSAFEVIVHHMQVDPEVRRCANSINVESIWLPVWSSPVPSPLLALAGLFVFSGPVARNLPWMRVLSFNATVAVMASICLPITFVGHSGTGPFWICVPIWYWGWLAVLGGICAAVFSLPLSMLISRSGRNENTR